MGFFDRLFGRKPAAPAATLDTSEANLRAVFGDDNVMIASGLWLDPVVWSEGRRRAAIRSAASRTTSARRAGRAVRCAAAR